jgi:arabinose-5-phosphate isomerase
MHTNSAAHGDLGIVRENDLVIVLTKSGETSESVYLAKLLKGIGASFFLLSFNRDSSLCKAAPGHLIMDLQDEGDPWNILPNNSTVLNLIVLQELAMQLAKELGVSASALRRNHPGGAIGERFAQSVAPWIP